MTEPTGDYARALNQHYGRLGLGDAILAGLVASGHDPDALTPDALAPVDQFHIRGKDATLELAGLAGLSAGTRVLDVGGGLGGAARTLAAELGCRVTVLDLTEEYCRVGEDLTRRAGLAERVSFRHGNALALPFPDASFDAAWTQHSSMNVPEKPRLYAEIARAVRPGGRVAIHEIMAGASAPVHFPVPWAREPATSFLSPTDAVRTLVRGAGLRELAWLDVSGPSLEWFRQRLAAPGGSGPPPLGFHLLLGADFGPMFRNMARNLEEDRIRVIQGVWERD
ncbi:MAG: class I SAM-dependent methyltransferase [Candidatus Rokuibacteriota bacterium]